MGLHHLGSFQHHFWLTRSVARLMGVSFTEAMAKGDLTATEFTDLITRCRQSGCSTFCETWLAAQNGAADSAPTMCPNADCLDRLKQAQISGRSDRKT